MNLHHLRVFAAVAEHGGVVAASKALNLSQPAVSHAIREFELQVGLPVERTGRGVRLTPEGAEIYAHARGVYAAERSVEEAIASLKGVEQGNLHLGEHHDRELCASPDHSAVYADASGNRGATQRSAHPEDCRAAHAL